ncbi:uncharacterized protein [Nicotiana sylvestris]|uniref:uncharacterized protein n=1 Tax=Nicotiana sylvestris TaxID=4096 RepID=UPI00388C4415
MVEAQLITEEVLQTFDSIQVERQSILEIDNEQALGIQVLESAPVIEEVAEKNSTQLTRRRSNLKQKEYPTMILRENALLDKIKVGLVFDKKKSIINCFSNTTIKGHFEFKVVRSRSKRYSLKCNDDRCGWCVRAFRIKDSTLFKIVKIEKKHDCSVNTMKADQRHATSKLICGYIIDNLRDPKFEVTPAFVVAEMQKLFLYMFYAYGSSISGWNHCRPVIAIDATFLKSKFRGVLMISVSKNANNQIFPLAFGIAESENNNSYSGIAIAYGIAKNLKRRKVKSEVIKLFQSAARVYRRNEFDLYMSDIAKVDKKTYDYLMEEPPERWARSCSPRRRYDMLTTNIVESTNSVLLEARELPILRMMEFIPSEATTLVL